MLLFNKIKIMKKLSLLLMLSFTVFPALAEYPANEILKICKKSIDYNKCKSEFKDRYSKDINKPIKIKVRPYKRN